MTKISIVSPTLPSRWKRHFPEKSCEWNGFKFDFGENANRSDIVVVYDSVPPIFSGTLKPKRCFFIASEPPSVKTYRHDFLSQFDLVLTTDQAIRHPNAILGQVAIPWHVAVRDSEGNFCENPMTLSEFESWTTINKTKNLSIVASSKSGSAGHRERLLFATKLKDYFGDEVDFFGRNINSFNDKIDVLQNYRYHIAIENSSYRDYWTEKLSDPLLTLTFPIYFGCPNVDEYFEKDQLELINIRDIDGSIRKIKKIMDSDLAERSHRNLIEARRRVLYEHNIISVITRIVSQNLGNTDRSGRVLYSEECFAKRKSKIGRLLYGFAERQTRNRA